MVVDIHGCNNILFDPDITSNELVSEEEFHFCAGNLSRDAINNFIGTFSLLTERAAYISADVSIAIDVFGKRTINKFFNCDKL